MANIQQKNKLSRLESRFGKLFLTRPKSTLRRVRIYQNPYGQMAGWISSKSVISKAISQGEYPQEEMTKIHFIAKDYQRKDVYNVDEIGLFWGRGPDKGLMAEESRLCVIFCTNADDSDKLPLHYTGKSMTPWDFTQREFVQKEWTWTSNKTAWMTGELMANWLDMYYKHMGQDRNVLLLMDGYSIHKMAVLENPPPSNIRIEFLPNPVSGLQPLRQSIIYEAKLRYIRHLINEQILFYKAVWETESAGVETTDVKPKISLRDAVWWLQDVWKNEVTSEKIQHCFERSMLFSISEEFFPPEIPAELGDLYRELLRFAGIRNALKIGDFICPDKEDIPPVSYIPIIDQLTHGSLPISEADEESEDAQSTGENVAINWGAGIKAANVLLHLLNHLNEDTTEFKHQCRKMIEKFAKIVKQSSRQSSLDVLLNNRAHAENALGTSVSRQPTLDIFSRAQNPSEMSGQIQNPPIFPFQQREGPNGFG